MKLNKYIFMLFAGLMLASCTGDFDDWNINPNEATDEMLERDNLKTGAYFQQMLRNVFIVGTDKGGEYQITEMLAGDLYGGYFSNIGQYSYASTHNAHYNLYQGWYNAAFNDAYTDIMQPWYSIKQAAETETPAVYALATVIKVFGMSRITDMYGPIPYTQFGGSLKVAYDSQETVYKTFFQELGDAITVLTNYYNADTSSKILADYDYVYSGNVENWIKFANTLRLRLALRVVYANESLAKEQAQAALNNQVGLMASAGDAAAVHQGSGLSFLNPIWEVCSSFNDSRLCASFESYLKGYNDPRMSLMWATASDGDIHGVYPGIQGNMKSTYTSLASCPTIQSGDDMPWMSAAESYFLQAEAALRWGIGSGTAQELYEQGITVSFAERGASNVSNYINNSTSKPADYTDPSGGWNNYSASAVGTITIKWSDSDSFEKKLERIITQKWIAIYPDGQEAWSEFRRTNYPKLFTVASNQSGGTVDTDIQIRRLKFPTTEYERNTENVNAAVSLLGGADTGGTQLWWDKKSH